MLEDGMHDPEEVFIEEKMFSVGDRVRGLVCLSQGICPKLGGCRSNENNVPAAAKVIGSRYDSFFNEHLYQTEITHCPERPDMVGRRSWSYGRFIEHLD